MKGRKNMAKKIGLVGIYFPGAYDALHENVPEGFELVDALSPEAYGNLADCEYLISRLDIDPDIINHTPNVKFWQRWGAGFDHVDLKAWGERGIPIATCPGVNSGIVAELAIMLMLAGYRNLLQINRQLRAGHWPRTEYFGRSFMIKGKTVGVLGLGHIGKKVAALATAFGANVISVKGNYEETFELSKKAIDKWGWYNRNAAINPYLSEGKKTVSIEIAEQFDWKMPDYLAISVGDGCTIAGVWKGLKDLYAIGFIDKLPRLISAQAEGCHPINRAIAENKPWEPMEENTLADSIAVGVPRNADKALMAIHESNGIVVNVTDEEIMAAQKLLGTTCGVFGEPAGVTGTAAVKKACELGLIGKNDTVVSVVTGNGLKDVANAIKSAGEPIHIEPDLDLMVEEFKKRGVTVE